MIFVCWKWRSEFYGEKFNAGHVNVLAAMLRRRATVSRLICITDDSSGIGCETFPLWDDYSQLFNPNGTQYPSCYRRLKIFNPETTRAMGIADGELVVSIDLDVVIVSDLDRILTMWPDDDFVGWRALSGYAWRRPRYLNGSLFRFRAGRVPYLWSDFDPVSTPRRIYDEGYFGTDQGWLSMRLKDRSAWDDSHGVYAYSWVGKLPTNARIISFNGPQKPWQADVRAQASWIGRHYCLG